MRRPVILTFADYYLPGYRWGGPIRTVANIVEHLGEEIDFRILTRDRDYQDARPYPGVPVGEWTGVGPAQVLYLPPEKLGAGAFRQAIADVGPDAVYLNSCLSPRLTIPFLALRRLGRLPRLPVLLAPRGECSRGSMSIKAYKKRPYVWLARQVGLYRDVTWHASTRWEAADIQRVFGAEVQPRIAADLLPRSYPAASEPRPTEKRPGKLRVLFLSRISPEKNLLAVLAAVAAARQGQIELTIAGPAGNRGYWEQCQRAIRQLPAHVTVRMIGELAHDEVVPTMREHDLFFLPTLGENFGHVIVEALVAGCPVLLSDRTPWRQLTSQGVGWDLPLETPAAFVDVLDRLSGASEADLLPLRRAAARLGQQTLANQQATTDMRHLLYEVAGLSASPRAAAA